MGRSLRAPVAGSVGNRQLAGHERRLRSVSRFVGECDVQAC